MELEPIEGGDWRELDYREDSWHSVWLGWEKKLNLIALVMTEVIYNTVVFDDGGTAEVIEEEVSAAVIPNSKASEGFIHPKIYIERYRL